MSTPHAKSHWRSSCWEACGQSRSGAKRTAARKDPSAFAQATDLWHLCQLQAHRSRKAITRSSSASQLPAGVPKAPPRKPSSERQPGQGLASAVRCNPVKSWEKSAVSVRTSALRARREHVQWQPAARCRCPKPDAIIES